MNDYISRDDVLKAIDYQHEVNNVFESEAAYVQMWETINDDIGIPSADVQAVRHGRWSECYTDTHHYSGICSVCGKASIKSLTESLYEYCPKCGARMIKDGDTE